MYWGKKNNKNRPKPGSPAWLVDYFERNQSIDPQLRSKDVEFAVIDLEATGLDIHKDRIISFGLIPVQDFEIIPAQSFQCFVRQTYFDRDTVPIHGILQDEIQEGLSEEMFLETIIPLLAGRVLVGHHVGYDTAMLNQALQRHYQFSLTNLAIDTGDLYKKTFPSKFMYRQYPSHSPSLDEIAAEFEILTHNRHSAIGDATITAFIFMKLWKLSEGEKKHRLRNLL